MTKTLLPAGTPVNRPLKDTSGSRWQIVAVSPLRTDRPATTNEPASGLEAGGDVDSPPGDGDGVGRLVLVGLGGAGEEVGPGPGGRPAGDLREDSRLAGAEAGVDSAGPLTDVAAVGRAGPGGGTFGAADGPASIGSAAMRTVVRPCATAAMTSSNASVGAAAISTTVRARRAEPPARCRTAGETPCADEEADRSIPVPAGDAAFGYSARRWSALYWLSRIDG
jgi:hypothetical protein